MEDAIFKRGIDKLRLSWTVLDELTTKKPFTDRELEALYHLPPVPANAPQPYPFKDDPPAVYIIHHFLLNLPYVTKTC